MTQSKEMSSPTVLNDNNNSNHTHESYSTTNNNNNESIITITTTTTTEEEPQQQPPSGTANSTTTVANEDPNPQPNQNNNHNNTASSLSTISENNSDHSYYEEEHHQQHHHHTITDDLSQVLDLFNENVLPTLMITEKHIHDDLKHRASLEHPEIHGHKHHQHLSQEELKKELQDFAGKDSLQQKSKPSNRRRIVNLILFLFGTMFFKFSYETLSGAIGLTILTRLEGHPLGATTILSLLTITFGLSQSISSSTVEGLLKIVRATRLYCISLLIFSALIITMIVLEATTGGTLTTTGYWTPWIIFPIYVFIGFSVGVIEVVRKIIPASILGNSESSTLKRLNAGIHISYEIAGTVGAFLSSVFIEKLGTIYALFHMPVCFFIGSLFFFFITLKDTERILEEEAAEPKQEEDLFKETPRENRFVSILKKVGKMVKDYFYSMHIGAKITLTNRYYIWLIPCFVIPQVLHRLIENIFLPAFSKMILKKGSYSGIMLGGSNFGELVGAGLLLIFARKVKLPTIWIILDSVFLNLMWIFPFLTFTEGTDENLIFAICIVPAMVMISGSWAAADISQIAYLQSTLSDEPNEVTGVNELAAVMSFLYSCYIVLTTLVAFGLSQAVDRFKESGTPQFGFMTICIVMTVISFAICIIYLTVAKFKPSPHDDHHLGEEQREMQQQSHPHHSTSVESNIQNSIEQQTVNV